jgi:hypothetical protein
MAGLLVLVVPSRIELESRASETLILSVVLQDLTQGYILLGRAKLQNYFNNPRRLVLNIFTAIASRTTPKNLRMAIIPA